MESKNQKILTQRSNIQDFRILGSIGKGSFSEVVEVVDKQSKLVYALKILDKKKLVKMRKENDVFVEKLVLENVQDPCIVKLHSAFQDKKKLYFLMEKLENENFAQFL